MEMGSSTLDQEIKAKKAAQRYFTGAEMTQLARSLVAGLHELHCRLKMAHRDIKPSNIVRVKERYKIADLATCKEYNQSNYGQTHTLIGTISYFSPQLRQVYENLGIMETSQTGQENNSNLSVVQKDDSLVQYYWDQFKNDLFSLGLTLLYAASLRSIQQLNQKPALLADALDHLSDLRLYDAPLLNCIQQLLTWEEASRPSIEQVKRTLEGEA